MIADEQYERQEAHGEARALDGAPMPWDDEYWVNPVLDAALALILPTEEVSF